MGMYVRFKTREELEYLEKELKTAGYGLDEFNTNRDNAVGIYTYNAGVIEDSYGFLSESMIGDFDARTSWICNRHRCDSIEEFVKGL